jgi:hypothetical protein
MTSRGVRRQCEHDGERTKWGLGQGTVAATDEVRTLPPPKAKVTSSNLVGRASKINDLIQDTFTSFRHQQSHSNHKSAFQPFEFRLALAMWDASSALHVARD